MKQNKSLLVEIFLNFLNMFGFASAVVVLIFFMSHGGGGVLGTKSSPTLRTHGL